MSNLWNRVSDFFRGGDSNGHGATGVAEHTSDHHHDHDEANGHGHRGGLTWLGRPRAAHLKESYERVANLMDAMHEHFDQQDERSKELTRSVERVAGILEQLAEQQRVQNEHVAQISRKVEEGSKHQADVAASMVEMPATMKQQSEAIRNIGQQLGESNESKQNLSDTLLRFGQSVDSLRQSSNAQVQTLSQMQRRQDDEQEALKSFIRKQNIRFVIVAAVAGGIGLTALLWLGYSLSKLAA